MATQVLCHFNSPILSHFCMSYMDNDEDDARNESLVIDRECLVV